MTFIEKYLTEIKFLLDEGNSIIRNRIRQIFFSDDVSEIVLEHPRVIKCFEDFDHVEIHGSKDRTFENTISKLLDYGIDNRFERFRELYEPYLNNKYFNDTTSFNDEIHKTVMGPFMIRAGYHNHPLIEKWMEKRINKMVHTIEKYGHDIYHCIEKGQIKINIEEEWLPTIYDLYALAFYPKEKINKEDLNKIIQYVLTDEFQSLPDNAYTLDASNKRWYATGSVYHACFRSGRELLMVYLLSHFEHVKENKIYKSYYQQLKEKYKINGCFDKTDLIDKKDMNYLYTGARMGMGENRRKKSWLKLESTYWMLMIDYNLYLNGD